MAEGAREPDRQATPSEAGSEAQRLLDRLLAAVDTDGEIAIHPHDHPDPDSIAAAYALQHLLSKRLGVDATIAYGGTIGRASNRAMVDLLGIPMVHLSTIDLDAFATHCLIDTQPRAGNHSLPDDLPVAIAIDHHPAGDAAADAAGNVRFLDVRTEYGATSTILYYYLKAAGLDLPTKLATALLMGIKSDTRDLEREASEADLRAYLEIFPRADLALMTRIERPRIPQRYFEAFHAALEAAVLYDGALVSDLGEVENPDLVAELADFFIPLERVEYALVMGRYDGRLHLSLRTRTESQDAGALIARVVGDLGTAGGHGRMAGAQVDHDGDAEGRTRLVRRRFLEALDLDPERKGEALVRAPRGSAAQ